VLTLLVVILLLGGSLITLFWVGTFFFQGWIYTEPSAGINWQAPAAGAAVTAFLAAWCVAVATSDEASTTDIPYDNIFRFSPEVAMFDKPAKKMWALKQGNKVVEYDRKRLDQTRYCYVDNTYDRRPWSSSKVEALELEYQGKKVRFTPKVVEPTGGPFGKVSTGYREYVSADGWVMRDYDDTSPTSGPTGLPLQFRSGRFIANLFFNFGFWLVLFLSFWLLLRFQWAHALGFSFVLWLAMTLTMMPMVLTTAAGIAQNRPAEATQKAP
jgi:hypothetical protein